MDTIVTISVLVLATASIAITISKGEIFKPWRVGIEKRSKWLGELVTCSYCVSHWVAFVLSVIFRPRLGSGWVIVDVVTTTFVVVTLATPVAWLVFRSYRTLEPGNPEAKQLREALQLARTKILEQQEQLKEAQSLV